MKQDIETTTRNIIISVTPMLEFYEGKFTIDAKDIGLNVDIFIEGFDIPFFRAFIPESEYEGIDDARSLALQYSLKNKWDGKTPETIPDRINLIKE